jgi:hypothetical protein
MITFTKHQRQDGNPKNYIANNYDFINQHPDVNGIPWAVATALCQFAGKDGRCFPSHATISERTGFCKSAVRKALKQLEQKRVIDILHDNRVNGSQQNNTYVILSPDNEDTSDRLKINFHNRGAYTYDPTPEVTPPCPDRTPPCRETTPLKHKEKHKSKLHVHADVISIKRDDGYSPGSTHDAHAERTPGKKDSCHIEPDIFKKTDAATMDHYRGEFITAGLITDSQDDKNRFYSVWLTTSRNWKSGKVRSPGAYFRKAIATGDIYITQSIDDAAAQLIKGKSTPQRTQTSESSNLPEPPQSTSNRVRTWQELEKIRDRLDGECCRLKGKPGHEEAMRKRDEAERRYREEHPAYPETATDRIAKAA